MASYSWIKLYHEVLHDPKMGRLTDNLWRRVIEVFLLAGENGGTGELPPLMDMAWTLRLSIEELEANLKDLERYNIVTQTPSGWIVTHYSKRQAPIDTTERVKSYRERVKKHDYYEPVTEEKQTSNEYVTNRCTDTDKNKIQNREDHSALKGAEDAPKFKTERQKACWSLENSFSKISSLPIPERTTDKQKKAAALRWWNPLLEIWELCKHDTDRAAQIIGKAYAQMAHDELTISAPASVLEVAKSIYAKNGNGQHAASDSMKGYSKV